MSHTIILDDPFDDPDGLDIPDRSPEPTKEQIQVCGSDFFISYFIHSIELGYEFFNHLLYIGWFYPVVCIKQCCNLIL